jgi:hypothetical protein
MEGNMVKTALKSLSVLSTLMLGTMLSSGQARADTPVFISNLLFNGSGCNALDSAADLMDTNDDGLKDSFIIIFSNYIAQQGKGIPISDRRKNCNISVGLVLPQGYQFTIADVDYQGFADVPKDVSGWQVSTYQFVFWSRPVTLQSRIRGPFQGTYSISDTLGLGSLIWSPCGREVPLNIRTQVFLSGDASKAASMTTDQISGRVRQVYQFKWRRCGSSRS